MPEPNIQQQIDGSGNIFTATGNVYNYKYIINFPKPPSMDEISGPSKEGIPPCPYKGLFAFRPEDAELFFGRESTTKRLLEATLTRNFVALIGASGSGKSSVVYAGLTPQLHQQQSCLITYFRPEKTPFVSLARALLPLYDPNLTKTDLLAEANKLADHFQQGEICISDIIALVHDTHPEQRVFLIADQFEELYTLSPNSKTHHKLIDLLLEGRTSDLKNSLNIVLTMRADFMGQAAAYRPFADALQGNIEILGPMTQEELTSAVEEPSIKQGVGFENELVSRILDDVGTEPGQLPLLEFALTEMWNLQRDGKLTHDAYSKIGRVGGALEAHADKVYRSLNDRDKHSTKRILLRLVRSGQDTEDTRRLATRHEIGDKNWQLIAELASERLVVTSKGEDGKDRVEIIHEALIRSWARLVKWLNEDREFRLWQGRLHDSLVLWNESNRNRGALLQGVALTEARQKINERSEELSPDELSFIHESIKWSRIKQITLLGTAFGGIFILAVAITLGITGQLNRFFYRPLPMEWVKVDAGEFLMGSSETDVEKVWETCPSCDVLNEQPQHLVYLDTFEIGKYEVTNEQYRQCVRANVCNKPTDNPFYEEEQYHKHSVVGVNWEGSRTFCEWNGGRLPTEAEWEKAARGSETLPNKTRSFPWGNEWDSVKVNADNPEGNIQPVGSYSPEGDSIYGAADMSGNVWEWVMDWYGKYEESEQPQLNPIGSLPGEYRILRGGSFEDSMIEARSTYRLPYLPGFVYPDVGFRCSRIIRR